MHDRNLKLTVEYEGTAYHGWQSQRGHPSVQGELERAVSRVVDHPVTLYGSGRTDRGVHALGQVASFRTSRSIPPPKLLLGINTYLPEDIRVREVEEVPLDFHARYSAQGKRYRYACLLLRSAGLLLESAKDLPAGAGALRHPLPAGTAVLRRLVAPLSYPVDVNAMREGAIHLEGVHDFRSFEGNQKRRPPAAGEPPRSTVRTVAAVVVRQADPFLFVDAFGRGFLYGMVRAMVGTLLEVGQGKRRPEDVGEALRGRDRRRAGFTAPAQGLCLLGVYYDTEDFREACQAAREGREGPGSAGAEHERLLKAFW